jgi:hypothetical protein
LGRQLDTCGRWPPPLGVTNRCRGGCAVHWVRPTGLGAARGLPVRKSWRPAPRASDSPTQRRRPWWWVNPIDSIRPNGPTVQLPDHHLGLCSRSHSNHPQRRPIPHIPAEVDIAGGEAEGVFADPVAVGIDFSGDPPVEQVLGGLSRSEFGPRGRAGGDAGQRAPQNRPLGGASEPASRERGPLCPPAAQSSAKTRTNGQRTRWDCKRPFRTWPGWMFYDGV